MQPQVKALFDQAMARIAALELELRRAKADIARTIVTLSGSFDSAWQTGDAVLSGTVNARIVDLSGSVDRAWKTGDSSVMTSLSTGVTSSVATLSGTVNARFINLSGSVDSAWKAGDTSLSGTINAKFVSGLRLLGVQEFTGSVIYTPTPGTIAIHGIIVGSGGGGGAGQTVAGAAGSGGGAGEWLEFWYSPGSDITGQAVNVGFPGITNGAGQTSGIMLDGITFAAIGGSAGSNNGAVASYAEADAKLLGTSGSTSFDIFRGSNASVAAMASSTTTISAYTAGIGGGTPYGRGGRGSSGDTVGDNGLGFGSGGGGGRRGAAINRNGGNGGSGSVILREYGR